MLSSVVSNFRQGLPFTAVAIVSVLLVTACSGPQLPNTETEAIEYVKSRLHPYQPNPDSGLSPAAYNRLNERCRSFLKWASWSADKIPDGGWTVTGQVDYSQLAGRYLSDLGTLTEISKGRSENRWIITSEGDVLSLMLSGCDGPSVVVP